MRVTMFEFKKIFEGRTLFFVIALTAVYYILFVSGIGGSRFNEATSIRRMIVTEMLDNYGLTLDVHELEHFQQKLHNQILTFEAEIALIPEAQERGIVTYNEFLEAVQSRNEFTDAMRNHSIWSLFNEIAVREDKEHGFVRFFNGESKEESLSFYTRAYGDERIIRRITEFYEQENVSIFHNWDFGFRADQMAFASIMNVILLLGPYYLKERKNKMPSLQATTRVGRRLFLRQLTASLMAGVCISLFHILLYLPLFLYQLPANALSLNITGIGPFFDSTPWYDISFGFFIFFTSALVVLCTLIVTFLTLFTSKLAPNYLTILAIWLPVLFLLLSRSFLSIIINGFFNITLWFLQINPPLFLPLAYIGMITVTAGAMVWLWFREKRQDVNV